MTETTIVIVIFIIAVATTIIGLRWCYRMGRKHGDAQARKTISSGIVEWDVSNGR
jgi:hypothetical protein